MSDPLAAVAGLPGVPEAVRSARTAVDRLYGHRVLRRRGPEVSAESALRGARASAALEGAGVPLEALRSGADGSPVAAGALRASAEIGRLGAIWRSAPRQALARLHALAAAGLVPEALLGRPRTGPEDGGPGTWSAEGDATAEEHAAGAVGALRRAQEERLDGVRPEIADVLGLGPAPEADAAAVRLTSLVSLITSPTKAPALVLGAIVHAELVTVRPFGSFDGLVARAAERLTLVEFGLDPKSLVAVEVGHHDLGDAYAENLRGYMKGTSEGVGGWIRHCAAAVELGAREATAVCEALQRG
ncbi:oxidoreductase [Sphaerisporangium melleum]|uniref:Oxidoreductase n=1 Tax=Sphaerisporangium melleum TaxID=321316 RepID=A0A917RBY0_9ACTN|nr:oxidoreductase [Sphaerisporangium melleum]GGK98655.1 oxidoreductase [Sphaerisporangium melleum]GII73509.1 oxidoreductase [Sphaerisporangium melleum]